jgi:alpha-tubulin suppressor-like RCC1 family protein
LGNDTTVNSASPVQASVVNNAVGVAAGTSFSLGLGSDGTVWSWGLNNHGQLGVPNSYTVLGIPFTLTTQRNFPAAVAGITNVIQLSAGVYDSVALKGNGTVWVWGEGTEGELGNGTSSDSSIPVQVSSLTGMIQVAAGNQHVVALQSNGTVWTWGSNSNGQLGNNSTTNSSTPVQVTALSGTFIAVGAGVNFSVALRSDGTVWAWGANPDGELGNSTTTQSLTPVQVTGLNGIIAISSGGKNTFALQNNGNLWTWGLNGNGQLGNGTTTSSSTALQVTGLTTTTAGVTGLGTGSSALHSLALIGNSAIYGWGDNTNGDLGDGTTTQRTSPTLASTVSNSPPVVAPTITLTEPGGATQF